MNHDKDNWITGGGIWGHGWGLPDDRADHWRWQADAEQRRQLAELQACYLEELVKQRKLDLLAEAIKDLRDDLDKLDKGGLT